MSMECLSFPNIAPNHQGLSVRSVNYGAEILGVRMSGSQTLSGYLEVKAGNDKDGTGWQSSDSYRDENIDVSCGEGYYNSFDWIDEHFYAERRETADRQWEISNGEGNAKGGREWNYFDIFTYDNKNRWTSGYYSDNWNSNSIYAENSGWQLSGGTLTGNGQIDSYNYSYNYYEHEVDHGETLDGRDVEFQTHEKENEAFRFETINIEQFVQNNEWAYSKNERIVIENSTATIHDTSKTEWEAYGSYSPYTIYSEYDKFGKATYDATTIIDLIENSSETTSKTTYTDQYDSLGIANENEDYSDTTYHYFLNVTYFSSPTSNYVTGQLDGFGLSTSRVCGCPHIKTTESSEVVDGVFLITNTREESAIHDDCIDCSWGRFETSTYTYYRSSFSHYVSVASPAPSLELHEGSSDIPTLSGPAVPDHIDAIGLTPPGVTGQVCFVAGHWVELEDGSKKTVETLDVGDIVRYIHHEDSEAETNTVSKIRSGRVTKIFHNAPAETWSVTCRCEATDETKTIRGTAEHPFYVVSLGWTTMVDLAPGLELLGSGGNRFIVTDKVHHAEKVPVFNIEVEGGHTYFVSDTETGEGILVHNDCQWHHMLPDQFREQFKKANFDIDSSEFGWLMENGDHADVHRQKWNDEWRDFFKKNPDPSKRQITNQLNRMQKSEKFAELFAKGIQADVSYGGWRNVPDKAAHFKKLRGPAEEAVKKGSKALKVAKKAGKVGKIAPFLGTFVAAGTWGLDVYAKGPVAGTANTALDAIPIFGTVKGVTEFFTGDFIPDKVEVKK